MGDALGKLTEGYWPREIAQTYGGPITNFCKPIQPRSRWEWAHAEVTDDTHVTLLVAESILEMGKVDRLDIARRILEKPIKGWPDWDEFRAAGGPEQVGHRTGNGAPMRISPVGIIDSP